MPSPGALARARRWHDALDIFDELAFWMQNGETSLVLGDLYVVMQRVSLCHHTSHSSVFVEPPRSLKILSPQNPPTAQR